MSQAFATHDHHRCIRTGLREAESRCAKLGLRLTPVRRRALEILLENHSAMGAYEVLEKLREDGFGSQPPVAYRALEFLTKNGFAHRIERLNSFIACAHPAERHVPAFLICRSCDVVAEATTEAAPILGDAAKLGFEIERTVLEAEGLCPNCAEEA